MEMPVVQDCSVQDCAYNQDQACHALAITVGDMRHPHCDTFLDASFKGGDRSGVGHVGACKMADCAHNVNLECQAPGISVGYRQDSPDCLTYQPA